MRLKPGSNNILFSSLLSDLDVLERRVGVFKFHLSNGSLKCFMPTIGFGLPFAIAPENEISARSIYVVTDSNSVIDGDRNHGKAAERRRNRYHLLTSLAGFRVLERAHHRFCIRVSDDIRLRL